MTFKKAHTAKHVWYACTGELVEINTNLVLFCFFKPAEGAPHQERCLILKFLHTRLLTQSEQFANELTRHLDICAPTCRILRQKVCLWCCVTSSQRLLHTSHLRLACVALVSPPLRGCCSHLTYIWLVWQCHLVPEAVSHISLATVAYVPACVAVSPQPSGCCTCPLCIVHVWQRHLIPVSMMPTYTW